MTVAPALVRTPEAGLSAAEAKRLALRAQGFLGRPVAGGPAGVLARVFGLQLDTISVLARSHELVCYARVGAAGRAAVEAACWGLDPEGDAAAMEYWGHAACIMPIALWPWFAFRRRELAARPRWGGYVSGNPVVEEVRRRLAAEGPLTSSDLGGSKNGGPWWDWSPMKVAVERLLDLGEVICTTRRGWRRVYDLTERALPSRIAAMGDPPDDECFRTLVNRAGRALGVATVKDLAEYFRLPVAGVSSTVASAGLVPVSIEGWASRRSGSKSSPAGAAWAAPDAVEAVGSRGRHRTTLLSPFDSLVWDRARTERVFGFTHRLEAYTPAAQRVYGYYAMPLLAGGRLIGRVDPKRAGKTLVAQQVSLGTGAGDDEVGATVEALRQAATWVGCDNVVVERCLPVTLRSRLAALLGAVSG
ncbi:MAG: winged helix-turn-helix domain-containing protein [Acidimicrobiales bacterium]